MDSPIVTDLDFTYQKPGAGVSVINLNDLPIDQSRIIDRQIIHFAPEAVGGNHAHPRSEWFVGFGELVLVWLDEKDKKHEIEMCVHDKIRLIEVSPMLRHAVINRSKINFGLLYELANAKMAGVVPARVFLSSKHSE